jgi:hypothetical protein
MTYFEGDLGPYLQYAHVWLTSLVRNFRAGANRGVDAGRAACNAGYRVPVGYVPGCVWACDAVAEHSTIRAHVRCEKEGARDGNYNTAKRSKGNKEMSNRYLLTIHRSPSSPQETQFNLGEGEPMYDQSRPLQTPFKSSLQWSLHSREPITTIVQHFWSQ